MITFAFSPAESSQRILLRQWFEQKHIQEWMHGVGLENTLNGLEKFFQGKSDIPLVTQKLAAGLRQSALKSTIANVLVLNNTGGVCEACGRRFEDAFTQPSSQFLSDERYTTYWVGYDKNTPFAFLITSPEGNDAITLDVFICDLNYLGKGLAVPMIREFLINHFPNVKRVLIDPEATNTRAIHVYQKVGFKMIGEFIASWHPVPHYQMELWMKDLLMFFDL